MKRKCQNCLSEFALNPRLGLKWAEKTGRGKYCNVKCSQSSMRGKHLSPHTEFTSTASKEDQIKHPRYKTGIWSYRRWKKERCEDCGSKMHLVVHHLDEDRNNNQLDNLKTVCAKCHTTTYHPRKFYGNQYVEA